MAPDWDAGPRRGSTTGARGNDQSTYLSARPSWCLTLTQPATPGIEPGVTSEAEACGSVFLACYQESIPRPFRGSTAIMSLNLRFPLISSRRTLLHE